MNLIQILMWEPWVARLGWTLIHFLWQGAAIAAVYAIVRAWILPPATGPRGRYSLACIALALMTATPVITYCLSGTATAERTVSAAPHLSSPTMLVAGYPAPVIAGPLPSIAMSWSSQALPWVVAVWFAGMLLCWVRLIGGCVVTARMRSTLVHPAPSEWRERFCKLRVRVGVSRPVRLLISSWVRVPMVIGWLRPVVLMPVGVLAGLSIEQVEAVLVHELAHIRRNDCLVNILQGVVEAFLFYHPAVWWISGHIRAERELCCDDSAISIAGNAELYALALAEVASLQSGLPRVAMAATGGSLTERISRILGQPEAGSRPFSVGGIVMIALIISAATYGLAQSPAMPEWQKAAGGKMAFDVASVKLDNSGVFKPPTFAFSADDSYTQTGGRLTADFSLPTYIEFAYKLWLISEQEQTMFSHLPGWVSSDVYAIEARAPGNPTKDQMRPMMQSLLADRFKLTVHFEARQGKILALTMAKPGKMGPNLRPHEEGAACDEPFPPPLNGQPGLPAVFPPFCYGYAIIRLPNSNGMSLIGSRNTTMDMLATGLAAFGGLGRPVVDRTGLSGRFDFTMEFATETPASASPDGNTPSDPQPGATFLEAVLDQLGLKLEPAEGTIQVLVIDHIEKPSDN